jgi:hypothetical protein
MATLTGVSLDLMFPSQVFPYDLFTYNRWGLNGLANRDFSGPSLANLSAFSSSGIP